MGLIQVHGLKLEEGKVTNYIEVSKDLVGFIKSKKMVVEYDEEIYADDSILNIPIVATILPLAWLTGSDIFVQSLDRGFKESMELLKNVFKTMLPLPKYCTEIHVDEIVDNKIKPEDEDRRTGLLFSGGVDSFYSLVSNLESKPRLVMYWGVEGPPYPVYQDYWEMVNRTYTVYAEKNDLAFNMVKTNVLELIYPRKVEHYFHRELYYGSLWVRLQESLVLLSLAAPLSIKRFDRLLIAASMYKGSPSNLDPYKTHSARPEIDEVITWADLRVEHHGTIDRAIKISGEVKDFFLENSLQLRVCLRKLERPKLNDSACEKCLRTIASLVLAGVDPNLCGFHVGGSTFELMKKYLSESRVTNDLSYEWSPIQKLIPREITLDLYGSRDFFSWFKEYDLIVEEGSAEALREVYHKLPYKAAARLDSVYRKMGVNIHEASPKRA